MRIPPHDFLPKPRWTTTYLHRIIPMRFPRFKIGLMLFALGWTVTNSWNTRAQNAGTSPASDMRTYQEGCRAFARNHPKFHFAHGQGDNPCAFELAPKSLNPMTATQEELEEWGLPKRPSLTDRNMSSVSYAEQLVFWKKIVAGLTDPRRHQTRGYVCTLNEADFKGPKSMWTMCGTADGSTRPHGIIQMSQPNTRHGSADAPSNTE